MKTMTCVQLGGACDEKFTAATFDEIAELSKAHGMAMLGSGDADHVAAMQQMMHLMQDPEAMQRWFDGKRAEFEAQAEDQ